MRTAASLLLVSLMVVSPASMSSPVAKGTLCFREAAERYGVSEIMLRAIAWHESRWKANALNDTLNRDGSEDVGVMQINSWWIEKRLPRYGITREHLWEPCLNIHIGAWIYADEIARHGNTWKAVGHYGSPNEKGQQWYIARVKKALEEVLAGEPESTRRKAAMPRPSGALTAKQIVIHIQN